MHRPAVHHGDHSIHQTCVVTLYEAYAPPSRPTVALVTSTSRPTVSHSTRPPSPPTTGSSHAPRALTTHSPARTRSAKAAHSHPGTQPSTPSSPSRRAAGTPWPPSHHTSSRRRKRRPLPSTLNHRHGTPPHRNQHPHQSPSGLLHGRNATLQRQQWPRVVPGAAAAQAENPIDWLTTQLHIRDYAPPHPPNATAVSNEWEEELSGICPSRSDEGYCGGRGGEDAHCDQNRPANGDACRQGRRVPPEPHPPHRSTGS